ncbi:MAG: thioredoxin family protein [Candidatus Nanopelagicales bacterium]
MRMRPIAAVPAAVIVGLVLAGCGAATSAGTSAPTAEVSSAAPSSTQPAPSPSASGAASVAARDGYVTYADYAADPAAFSAGPVVLFFHADWCPKCRETDANLTADPASLPDGLTVVKLDFDGETALRQQYGVTVQHTFVQVDASGQKVGVWTGTFTGAEIAAKVA